MSPTSRARWRSRVVVVAVAALCGCDLVVQAYGCGHDAGYGAMDCLLDDVEQRRASQAAWESSCASHDAVAADAQAAGDETCRGQGGPSRLVACDDPGPNRGTLPDGCSSFGDDGTFGCPADVSGECLCCDRALASCALGGDFCSRDEACCSGVCELADGGARGTCS
jgi:hypothetical protein